MIQQRLAVYQERLDELEQQEFPDEERISFYKSHIEGMKIEIEKGVVYPTIVYPEKKVELILTDSADKVNEITESGNKILFWRDKFKIDVIAQRACWVTEIGYESKF